jgi:BirA family biotin operon repressor/biotin-[acetyl-CoA-carboxylase] ligase
MDNKEGFAKEYIDLETVDSTNRYALDYGKPFVAVSAGSQSAGRGRRGHQWYSPEGNLFLSLTLPGIDTRYTVLAGVATRAAISEILLGKEPLIKWPNDILVSRRKIAGILCESRSSITAVGIGVNINQTEWPDDLISKAISLKLISGNHYKISDVSGLIIESIGKWYNAFLEEGFEPIKEYFLKYHIKSDYKPMLSDGVEIKGSRKTLINEELFFSGYTGL